MSSTSVGRRLLDKGQEAEIVRDALPALGRPEEGRRSLRRRPAEDTAGQGG
jgi:hypothetical protein